MCGVMAQIELTINCCLCGESHEAMIDLPDGWSHRTSGVDSDDGFCVKHAPVAKWSDSQCPGCVGTWGDCALWRGFAYSHSRDLTDAELDTIRAGVCPRRTNGSFSFSRTTGIRDIDLSERATTESGVVFVQAIRDYWGRHDTD